MTQSEKKQALEEWREHCKRVQSITDTAVLAVETPAVRDKRIARLRSNYAAFCEYYFPHFLALRDKSTGEFIRTIHNAPFHNSAAQKVKSTPNLKAVFMWPRGHAKSTHFDVFMPLWLMFQEKRLINFMVVVGKSEDSATRLLGDIQAELEYNARIIADFGKQHGSALWQEGEFKAANGVKFLACGRGQSPRGLRDREARPDYIVIDDLDDDELCRNEKRVHDLTDWVKEALFGALDVGRGRFIMVGNLISKTSVLYNLSRTNGVHLSKIQAIDRNGEPIWKEKWTKEEAQEYKEFVGYRAWEKSSLLAELDDIWFDTSSALWAMTPERATELVHELGAERVLFGTDYPVAYAKSELARFFALDLTEDERRVILYDNAARFLGL